MLTNISFPLETPNHYKAVSLPLGMQAVENYEKEMTIASHMI